MTALKQTNKQIKALSETKNVHGDLGLFEMTIHSRIHPNNGSLNHCPVFQFNGDLLAVELLQKLDQFHRAALLGILVLATSDFVRVAGLCVWCPVWALWGVSAISQDPAVPTARFS